MLQQRVLSNQHTVSQTKVNKSVLIINETLCKNNLNSVKDVPIIYVSVGGGVCVCVCVWSVINFVLLLILKCYYTQHSTSTDSLLR